MKPFSGKIYFILRNQFFLATFLGAAFLATTFLAFFATAFFLGAAFLTTFLAFFLGTGFFLIFLATFLGRFGLGLGALGSVLINFRNSEILFLAFSISSLAAWFLAFHSVMTFVAWVLASSALFL